MNKFNLKKPNLQKLVKRQILVMWLSNDMGMFTGFAKVTNKVCNGLAKDPNFKVFHISENYNGPPHMKGNVQVGGVAPDKIAESCVMHLNTIKPDFFVALEDTFTLDNYQIWKINFEGVKFIPYVPLDGRWIPTGGERVLRKASKIVSMAKFTQDCLTEE
mgnify:CR=1 FL=1